MKKETEEKKCLQKMRMISSLERCQGVMHIEGGIVTFKFEHMGDVDNSFVQDRGHIEMVWGENER